jgi:chitodextrinase
LPVKDSAVIFVGEFVKWWCDYSEGGFMSGGIFMKLKIARFSCTALLVALSAASHAYDCSNLPPYQGGAVSTGDQVSHQGAGYRCDVGGWCSQGGAYEPGVGWAWQDAWTLLGQCDTLGSSSSSSSVSSSSSSSLSSSSSTSASSVSSTSSSADSCAGLPVWESSAVYTGGNRVQYDTVKYEAQWWTQGENPSQSGEWGVWRNLGSCGASSSSSSSSVSSSSSSSSSSTSSDPEIEENFASQQGWYTRAQAGGAVTFNTYDASALDSAVVDLRFPGDPNMPWGEGDTPSYASEAVFNTKTHYGRYEARVKFATCEPTEELVNGIFIYHNDGSDQNGNGIADNTEIDFEWLCGEPDTLWLTTWTDYESDTAFRKKSRAINLRTGDYKQTANGREGEHGNYTETGNMPDVRIADFPSNHYYVLGFDWEPDRIHWYMIIDGKEVTLWDLTQQNIIPQREANFIVNLWHSAHHWNTWTPADYPSSDGHMRVDYFHYTPLQQ